MEEFFGDCLALALTLDFIGVGVGGVCDCCDDCWCWGVWRSDAVRDSFVVVDRDIAGLLVFDCERVDTERSRPGRFNEGALREDEGVTGEAVTKVVCDADDGGWGRFGGPGAGRCWASV